MSIVAGEYAKVVQENRVFKVHGLTKGRLHIPDGWLIDKYGRCVNPHYCEKYIGAISVIVDHV